MRSHSFIRDLEGSRILITGGAGFIGTWILMALSYLNDQFSLSLTAQVLSRTPAIFQKNHPTISSHRSIEFVNCNVVNLNPNLGEFSHIIHAATDTIPDQSRINEVAQTIISGTSQVLEHYGNDSVESFLFLSSGAVYGMQPVGIEKLTECHSVNFSSLNKDGNTYGSAKRKAELMVLDNNRHSIKRVVISRCFSFLAPFMYFDKQFAVGNFIKSTAEERQIVLNSDGSSVRSYMYVGDLVVWLLKMLLECPNKVILNTGSDQAMSIKESVVIVSNSEPGRVPVISSNERPRYRLRYVPSIETVKNDLKLVVWTDYKTSVRKILKWYKHNR